MKKWQIGRSASVADGDASEGGQGVYEAVKLAAAGVAEVGGVFVMAFAFRVSVVSFAYEFVAVLDEL